MLMVLAALLLSIGIASAELNYILPDSNSRELTWDEVARWDYETLGYAFNEIFARHGYVFHPGEKYDNYFSCQPWYMPNRDTNNQRAVYPYLNATEWVNYELIKEVRGYKAENGDSGESMWTYFSGGFDTLGGFDYVQLRTAEPPGVFRAQPQFVARRERQGFRRHKWRNLQRWMGKWLAAGDVRNKQRLGACRLHQRGRYPRRRADGYVADVFLYNSHAECRHGADGRPGNAENDDCTAARGDTGDIFDELFQ